MRVKSHALKTLRQAEYSLPFKKKKKKNQWLKTFTLFIFHFLRFFTRLHEKLYYYYRIFYFL